MNKWIHRFFAIMTLGPILLWFLVILATMFLGAVMGCTINESGAYPCDFLGRDIGETAAILGIFAAWGPLFFGPIVAASGLTWAVLALIVTLRKRARDERDL